MTDEDKLTMAEHGITSETKTVYHFQGHRYDRLSDAVSYAQKQSARSATAKPVESK